MQIILPIGPQRFFILLNSVKTYVYYEGLERRRQVQFECYFFFFFLSLPFFSNAVTIDALETPLRYPWKFFHTNFHKWEFAPSTHVRMGRLQKGSWNLIDGEEKKTKGRTWGDTGNQPLWRERERGKKYHFKQRLWTPFKDAVCILFPQARTRNRKRERESSTYIRTYLS